MLIFTFSDTLLYGGTPATFKFFLIFISACEIGSFKENPGFGMCQACPDQSTATAPASTVCTCDAGYYRASHDAKSAPCTSKKQVIVHLSRLWCNWFI